MALATRTDDEIKQDLVNQLNWDGRVDAVNIQVDVTDGIVQLTGFVPNYHASQAAGQDAWSIAGVMGLRNDLTVKYPPGSKLPDDAEIQNTIDHILLWQPDIDAGDIGVKVKDGWVTVHGSVDAYWKKVRIDDLILGLNGVLGITNELAVVLSDSYLDKSIAEDLEMALERDNRIDADLIDISVQNGKVKMTGSVPSLSASRAAQGLAENTLGVIDVDNQLLIR